MKEKAWKNRIQKACEEIGTYKPEFDPVIETLASIMEIRDEAVKKYNESGGEPVIEYTNKGGHTNLRKNPALQIINESNQEALAYWRDLGLTPSGFKKLDGTVVKKEGRFEDILSGLGI